MLSPDRSSAVPLARDAVQWVDHYGGITLHRPGSDYGTDDGEPSREARQSAAEGGDSFQGTGPSQRPQRHRRTHIREGRRSTSSVPRHRSSPPAPPLVIEEPCSSSFVPPLPDIDQQFGSSFHQPSFMPEQTCDSPFTFTSYMSGDIMVGFRGTGSTCSSYMTPMPSHHAGTPSTPPAQEKRRPESQQLATEMGECVTQRYHTQHSAVAPPEISQPPPAQEQPHRLDPSTRLERITRFFTRRKKKNTDKDVTN